MDDSVKKLIMILEPLVSNLAKDKEYLEDFLLWSTYDINEFYTVMQLTTFKNYISEYEKLMNY